ncbi:(Fe-S)-binding protein [Effusibacillus lacus]|uniref:Cysteine-rich domain-containing protein n=1 Tax=Effusibacillus lacus TaxID=1348429 RepID=A0A292YR94_9BACL|nr:(Fe-S)-binding protein [Effusibacillus lacus]TCS75905.1 cysteine-rich protein [Effusibacillus lacus]GAX91706.1 hypothetical protein EFBL_3396 [Effusibacillus lacus]
MTNQTAVLEDVILFVDYFSATQTSEVPRLTAQILIHAGKKVAILKKPAVTNGELLETDLNTWIEHAKENVSKLQATGIKKVVVVNPHEYVYFVREYPKYLGSLPFEVVFVTDYLWELVQSGEIKFLNTVNINASYHDPCSLNKMCNINESPRNIIENIPGISFVNESAVTQWNYCCGNGTASFKKIHPDIAYKIGQTRLRRAADLQTDTLILACPHCKDHLTEAQVKSGIDVAPVHLLELMAKAMGITEQGE